MAARCNFISVARADIQFACKEICQRVACPSEADWGQLKKLCRYLEAHLRMVMLFRFWEMPKRLDVAVDIDYAGCKRRCSSTNAGKARWGQHWIKSWAPIQTVVALSSGEAAYDGITKGACEGLGVVGLIEDLCGSMVAVHIGTDSSSSKATATRKGVGRVKHLETRALWVQDRVERGRIHLSEIPGLFKKTDVLTK